MLLIFIDYSFIRGYPMNIFIPLALLLALSFPVAAKNLYVDASSGDDSVTYTANSSSNPWRSIGRAA